jgi:hypothetical protein
MCTYKDAIFEVNGASAVDKTILDKPIKSGNSPMFLLNGYYIKVS